MENKQEVSLLIDGQVFNVNKDSLIEHSDYFRAMFSGNYVENEQQEISIDVVDANSMNIILRYMELGLIDLSEYSLATIGELAIAANFLQITELTKQINYCLEQQISYTNWFDIREIAQNISAKKLEEATIIYGLNSFKSLRPEYIHTINNLFWYLSHPYLNTDSELHVFKFGLQWIEQREMGADALLIILCCLDMHKLTSEDLKEMKNLVKKYENSITEKVVECLYKLSTEFELSVKEIQRNILTLCELYTMKVYTEVLNLVKESIQRKLRFIPVVPIYSKKDSKPEASPNYMFSFTEEYGFQQWLEVAEKNLWGWNIAAWSPTKIVVVCGEYGRGTGSFMRDVKVYDIHKQEWIKHGVQLPVRRHAGTAVVEDSLFIIGGVGGFRVVLDSAIIYDLKQRTFRKIAKLPDAIQSPAVCAHENVVYATGHKNIYKYEDHGNHDRWSTVLVTDMRPNCLVSYKGYIYVTQSYFTNMYRFKPDVNTVLEQIASFSNPPVTMCSIGQKLFAFTCSGNASTDVMAVEEYKEPAPPGQKPKVLWPITGSDILVNGVAGSCAVIMATPSVNTELSAYHERYLKMYG